MCRCVCTLCRGLRFLREEGPGVFGGPSSGRGVHAPGDRGLSGYVRVHRWRTAQEGRAGACVWALVCPGSVRAPRRRAADLLSLRSLGRNIFSWGHCHLARLESLPAQESPCTENRLCGWALGDERQSLPLGGPCEGTEATAMWPGAGSEPHTDPGRRCFTHARWANPAVRSLETRKQSLCSQSRRIGGEPSSPPRPPWPLGSTGWEEAFQEAGEACARAGVEKGHHPASLARGRGPGLAPGGSVRQWAVGLVAPGGSLHPCHGHRTLTTSEEERALASS